jgi:peptidyl-dipeptidase Dcp
MAAQAETLERIGMPRAIGMRHATPHFAHVFAGDGYSSGYYSYMWSEVMDADAFAAFEEAGDAFDPGLAEKLETHILSAGGSEDAAELYTAFRGRMPGVEALLKGRGLDRVAWASGSRGCNEACALPQSFRGDSQGRGGRLMRTTRRTLLLGGAALPG